AGAPFGLRRQIRIGVEPFSSAIEVELDVAPCSLHEDHAVIEIVIVSVAVLDPRLISLSSHRRWQVLPLLARAIKGGSHRPDERRIRNQRKGVLDVRQTIVVLVGIPWVEWTKLRLRLPAARLEGRWGKGA